MAGDEPPRDDRQRRASDRERGAALRRRLRMSRQMLASSVRIRVKDANGVYFGSGVVIDSTPGQDAGPDMRPHSPRRQRGEPHRSRRLRRQTLAHLSRLDRQVQSGSRPGTDRGRDPLPRWPSRRSPRSRGRFARAIRSSASAAARANLPSVERLRVTMLNRYVGPDTIECTGVPGQGRSGGGLFTMHGSVVGICTNADPQRPPRRLCRSEDRSTTCSRSAGLDDLIPAAPRARRDSLAEAAAVKTEPSPADEPRRAKVDSDMDAPPPAASAATGCQGRARSLRGQPARGRRNVSQNVGAVGSHLHHPSGQSAARRPAASSSSTGPAASSWPT